jgi:hypothetical protein
LPLFPPRVRCFSLAFQINDPYVYFPSNVGATKSSGTSDGEISTVTISSDSVITSSASASGHSAVASSTASAAAAILDELDGGSRIESLEAESFQSLKAQELLVTGATPMVDLPTSIPQPLPRVEHPLPVKDLLHTTVSGAQESTSNLYNATAADILD